MRERTPLDALNSFEKRYELHTPKSVGCKRSKTWALSVVPHFSLSPPRLAFLAWGDFHARSRFARSYYPRGKMRTTRSLTESRHTMDRHGSVHVLEVGFGKIILYFLCETSTWHLDSWPPRRHMVWRDSVGVEGSRSGLKSECADMFHQSFRWLLRHTEEP